MDKKQFKAIIMCLLGRNGHNTTFNKMAIDYMENNANMVMERCGLNEVEETLPTKTKKVNG